MISPLQIEFHSIHAVEAVESRIRQELAEFEKFYNRLAAEWKWTRLNTNAVVASAKFESNLGFPRKMRRNGLSCLVSQASTAQIASK